MNARRALVTGASSGIGEAAATRLAADGHRVALLARHANELERVRAGLARPVPERCLAPKWRRLAVLSVVAPRLGDRVLVRRMGGGWREPSWRR